MQRSFRVWKDCDILAVVLSDEILADLVNPKINTESKPVIRAVMKYIPIVGKTDKNGKQSNLIIYQKWEEVKFKNKKHYCILYTVMLFIYLFTIVSVPYAKNCLVQCAHLLEIDTL